MSCETNKPVFIGEIGWLNLNNAVDVLYPDWVNQVWKDLVDHIDQGMILAYTTMLVSILTPLLMLCFKVVLGVHTSSIVMSRTQKRIFFSGLWAWSPSLSLKTVISPTYF